MNNLNFESDVVAVHALRDKYSLLKSTIGKVVVGQANVVEQLLISILCNGHSLLVGVPGLAKTLLVKTLSECLELSFKRVQFTPDLMPSDILGTDILDANKEFKFIKGPIFANIVLADEINRTPPKTQAALLEAMQERNVTISGQEYKLPQPFFVLATQNPIEQEGTYPLPEAQLDRFLFQIIVDYPTLEEEIQVVKQTTSAQKITLEKVMDANEIIYFQELVKRVPVTDNVLSYAVSLVQKTRPNNPNNSYAIENLSWGAGPRASQNLIMAAKCYAILNGKFTPDIEDVKKVALSILRHRITMNYKAVASGKTIEQVIQDLL